MKKDKPLVSIISGYYNRVNYVEDSIQSLCDQTYDNIEIIIFDDCSTDGTYEKLLEFEHKDSRVKVLKQLVNKGFVNGLIDAINISKGEFIAIHGSGDFSYPTRIEKQVEVLSKKINVGAVGAYVNNIKFDRYGNEIVEQNGIPTNEGSNWIYQKLPLFTHGEVMFKKHIYDKAGGYRPFFEFAQDYDLWSRIALFSDFYTIPEILYNRYLRNDGASVVPIKKIRQAYFSEIIRYNISNRLAENKLDLIQEFDNEAFSNIDTYSTLFKKDTFLLLITIFKTDFEKNKILNEIIFNYNKISNKYIISIIFKLLYISPKKVRISIFKFRYTEPILIRIYKFFK